METSLNQDKPSVVTTETLSTKDDSHLSTINVVTAFKTHRLYPGWTLTEVINEMENLAKVSLDYPDECVLNAIRCLTEKAVELHIEGDGNLPHWAVRDSDEAASVRQADTQPVAVPEGEVEAADAQGVLSSNETPEQL